MTLDRTSTFRYIAKGTCTDTHPETLAQFRRFHLQERAGQNNHLLRERQLTQQFFAGIYARVMQARLDWLRFNQTALGGEKYRVICDASSQTLEVDDLNNKVIFSPTITGLPR